MQGKRNKSLPADPFLDPTRPLTFPNAYGLFESLISLRVRVGVLADAARSVSLQLSSAKIPPELARYVPPADGEAIDDYQSRAREMGIPERYRFWVRGLDQFFRELGRCRHELSSTRSHLNQAADEIDRSDAPAADRVAVRIGEAFSRLGGVLGSVEQTDDSIKTIVSAQYSERIRGFRGQLQDWINFLRPIAYLQSSTTKKKVLAGALGGPGKLSIPEYGDLKRQFTAASAKWKDLRCVGTICATEEPALEQETTVVGLRVLAGSKFHEMVAEYRGSARDHFTDATGRAGPSVIDRPLAQWTFYAIRLPRADRQAALARYQDLAETAWRITPARVREASCALPWLDPRAANSPVASWTALLHSLAWVHQDNAGYVAPRWIVLEGGSKCIIDSFFRTSVLTGSGVRDSYDSVQAEDRRRALEARGMTWPPRVFETALNIDLFLASVLAIDLIGRVFQIEGTETGTRARASATGWTKAELVRAAEIGPSTFDRILGKTKLPSRKRGDHGVKFGWVEVEEICATARRFSAGKRTWTRAATNLEKLLDPDAAN